MSIAIVIVIANSIIIVSDPFHDPSAALWILNISAAVASSLGAVAIFRFGIHDLHGKSILCLTIGLFFWLAADLTLLYSHYSHGEEVRIVSPVDWLWLTGYIFLALHLFFVIQSLKNEGRFFRHSNGTQTRIVIILMIVIVTTFSLFNIIAFLSSETSTDNKELATFQAIIVTIAYPILDLVLILPSFLILVTVRKQIRHYVPWLLSSISLLLSAVADDGYVIDFVNGHFKHLVFWDLFYVTDFIIMAGALFWYNKYYLISDKRSIRTMEVEP
ncbi:MAG TPA: hypothetical protein VH796_19195 [Nitrososphaeraceae archaeon]